MYQLQVAQMVVFVLVGFALPAVGMIGLAWLLQVLFGCHNPNPVKNQSYECGMPPLQEAHIQFDVRYYLYALLFIVFDIEIVFIIPWALTTSYIKELFQCPWLAPIEMSVFLLILVVGLTYAWAKGALEWE